MLTKRSYSIIILTVVTLLLAACGGDDEDPTAEPTTADPGSGTSTPAPSNGEAGEALTVSSEDGSVTVDVPAGALPDGVSADQIEVTTLPVDDFTVDTDAPGGAAVVAAVRLEPSGTEFAEPVTIRTRMPLAAAPGLVLLRSDGADAEVLAWSATEDEEASEVVATVSVDHFSELVYMGSVDVIKFEFEPPLQDHLVGETFTIRARIDRIDFEEEVKQVLLRGEPYMTYRFRPSDDRTWSYDVTIGVHGPAVTSARARFQETPSPDQNAAFIETEVTCERAGPYVATIGGYAKVGVRTIPINPPGETRDLRGDPSYGDFVEESALCIAADDDPTPTPTVPPTPTEASAISIGATSAVDHPPYACSYTNTGASVLVALLSGGAAAANAAVAILFEGAGLASTTLNGQFDGNGNARIEVPIQNFGPFSYSVVGEAGGVPFQGGDSGTVSGAENPAPCGGGG